MSNEGVSQHTLIKTNLMATLATLIPSTETSRQTTTSPVIDVRDVTVRYNGDAAIENVTFRVAAGERVAIIGPNGAGKSTLINAILGLIRHQSGEIVVNGDLRQLGYVPQHEDVNWNFPVTVRDVVMMGCLRQIPRFRPPTRRHWQHVDEALEQVGMSAFRDRQVGELSGGQRRRVFIARALAMEAHALLLDEPFSGVDASAQTDLMDVLEKLNARGLTIVLSTHDLDLAFHRFDKVLALRQRVVAFGTPREVYQTDVLAQLYGKRLLAWQDGKQVSVFVDEHGCGDC
jgi:ABC-type Mn2+/Zn2+ transport system ATPase subunit